MLQAFGGPCARGIRLRADLLDVPAAHPRAPGPRGSARSARDHDLRVDAGETRRPRSRRPRPDVVFLCAPNNPTGTPLGLDVIEAAYDATDGIVVVDEAYQEFAPRRRERPR